MFTPASQIDSDKIQIRTTRSPDAPRERVWDAYTRAKLFPRWWAPSALTAPFNELRVEVAGKSNLTIAIQLSDHTAFMHLLGIGVDAGNRAAMCRLATPVEGGS